MKNLLLSAFIVLTSLTSAYAQVSQLPLSMPCAGISGTVDSMRDIKNWFFTPHTCAGNVQYSGVLGSQAVVRGLFIITLANGTTLQCTVDNRESVQLAMTVSDIFKVKGGLYQTPELIQFCATQNSTNGVAAFTNATVERFAFSFEYEENQLIKQ